MVLRFYSAPMINKRLEYLGPGTLNFPYSSGGVASGSSQATPGRRRAVQVPTAYSTPARPSSRPIQSIEQPYTPHPQPVEHQVVGGQFSPIGHAAHPSAGFMFSSPSQMNLNTPLGIFSPTSSGTLLHGTEIYSSPVPIAARVDQPLFSPPAHTTSRDVAGSSAPKRQRETTDATQSSAPSAKRIKVKSSSRPALAPASQVQTQSAQIVDQGQYTTYVEHTSPSPESISSDVMEEEEGS
jgi:hypothetical protein